MTGRFEDLREAIRGYLEWAGATDYYQMRDTLTSYLDGKYGNRSIGQIVLVMQKEGLLTRDENMVSWVRQHPNGAVLPSVKMPERPVATSPELPVASARRYLLPEFQKTRTGHEVTIVFGEESFTNVVQVQLSIGGYWVNFPVPGGDVRVRIHVGTGIPQWAPEQEKNMGVRGIRLIFRDGSFEERTGLNPDDPVVIAYV